MPHRRQILGAVLAGAAMTACAMGDAVSSLAFDRISPVVAGALATVFGSVVFALWAGRNPFGRLVVRAPDRPGLLKAFHEIRASEGMPLLILRLAVGNAVVLPATYLSLGRLHSLETVISIAFGGPVMVTVWGLLFPRTGPRRISGLLCPLLAAVAMLALTRPWTGRFDVLGFGAAVLAAACGWNLLKVSGRLEDAGRLAQGTAIAGLLSSVMLAPVLIFTNAHWATGHALGICAASGLLSGFVETVLAVLALRFIAEETFGVLTGLEPVASLFVGWLFLREQITVLASLGVLLMVAAGSWAVWSEKQIKEQTG
ncbi:EamA family transporter [Actinomadura sp. DC4]|uniref:EamA family transporter n=1 Tax=Actinomadura sp. DC4 TaxID=3055069 RepID=UPI0025B13A59|nr:EamA family transporter [Actinomadura sp. DC4]MDN3358942.1 EamA family transporter [Actinomadura sp. DC4]